MHLCGLFFHVVDLKYSLGRHAYKKTCIETLLGPLQVRYQSAPGRHSFKVNALRKLGCVLGWRCETDLSSEDLVGKGRCRIPTQGRGFLSLLETSRSRQRIAVYDFYDPHVHPGKSGSLREPSHRQTKRLSSRCHVCMAHSCRSGDDGMTGVHYNVDSVEKDTFVKKNHGEVQAFPPASFGFGNLGRGTRKVSIDEQAMAPCVGMICRDSTLFFINCPASNNQRLNETSVIMPRQATQVGRVPETHK